MSPHLLTWIGNGLLCWAAAAATASVIVHSRVRWWATSVGTHLWLYMLTMAVVLDLGVVRLILGDTWWFSLLRLIVFTAVPVVMTHRLILQLRAQRAALPTRKE